MHPSISLPIRVVIVEDQQDPRDLLLEYLRCDHPHVEVVGMADTPQRATELVRSTRPDVLFLDIGLPDQEEGFSVLEALGPHAPYVIVTTGATGHALKAIKMSATDYLVKPIDPIELRAALDKAASYLARDRQIEQTNHLLYKVDRFGRFQIPTPKGYQFIPLHEIVYCESAGNYSTMTMRDGKEHAVTRLLGDLEKDLTTGFMRVHKKYLISLRYVQTYLKGKDGGRVVMSTGRELEVSREKKHVLLKSLASGSFDL